MLLGLGVLAPVLVRVRDDGRGLPGPPGDLQLRPVQGLPEQRRRRRQRRRTGDPDQRPEQNPAHLGPDLAEHQERGGLDRGQPLLRAQRRRLQGHRPRPHPRHPQPERGTGRLDDHPAVRQAGAGSGKQPDDPREVPRGGARLPARAALEQGQDPHRVPQHRLLRRGCLRDRGRRPHLLRCRPPRLRHQVRALRGGARAL